MSFRIRKLCPSPGKLKQATLSISVNKIDSLLPLSKVDSIFLLGLSPETITVAIFFFFSKDNTKNRNIAEESLCGHDSSKPS